MRAQHSALYRAGVFQQSHQGHYYVMVMFKELWWSASRLWWSAVCYVGCIGVKKADAPLELRVSVPYRHASPGTYPKRLI